MLKEPRKRPVPSTRGRFVIVASRYNARYVDALVRHARAELRTSGAASVRLIRVPGAFEIPVVAARLATAMPRPQAILCLGVIFRGETTHAEHIGTAVTLALAQIQVAHSIPVVHGVYLFENTEQARVRCLDRRFSRGIELARTAVEMADVLRQI